MDQRELASRAHVSVATVRRVETGAENAKASPRAVDAMRQALEGAGAEFTDYGVRCRKRRTPEEIEQRVRKIMEIAHRSAELQAQHPGGFTKDDLYDEDGLPA
jgi:transcriptional regulator with XRE-family HTH domain